MNMPVLPLGPPTAPLPRGRKARSRQEVLASQRGRMLLAITHAVADKGYPAVSVADVLKRARVSRATFYEHFSNKEECFATAYETAADVLATQVTEHASVETDLFSALRRGMSAYCAVLSNDLSVARALIIEIDGAPPAIRQRRAQNMREWAEMLEVIARAEADRDKPHLSVPQRAGAAAVGAITYLLANALTTGDDLSLLADVLADTAHRLLLVQNATVRSAT